MRVPLVTRVIYIKGQQSYQPIYGDLRLGGGDDAASQAGDIRL